MSRVCSFVPAATRMMMDMGLEQHLVGVTFECQSDRPKVVHSVLEGQQLSSADIDRIVTEYSTSGKSLYYVDMDLLAQLRPDVAFTQHVCEVCQIGTSYVERALAALNHFPAIVPLVPKTLDDIFADAVRIATAVGEAAVGLVHVAELRQRIASGIDTLRAHRCPPRRVMVMEWTDPVYNCGHWIPHQIAMAGGVDMLSNPSGYSIVTAWEKVLQYDPEVLVVAPCGYSAQRAAQDMSILRQRAGWADMTAVSTGQVYFADADLFTQPSAASIVDGIQVLSALFHPDHFEIPDHLQSAVIRLQGSTAGAVVRD